MSDLSFEQKNAIFAARRILEATVTDPLGLAGRTVFIGAEDISGELADSSICTMCRVQFGTDDALRRHFQTNQKHLEVGILSPSM